MSSTLGQLDLSLWGATRGTGTLPPGPTDNLLITQSGDFLITQSGENLVWA